MKRLFCVFAAAFALSPALRGAASEPGYDVAAYVWPAYQPEPRWAELNLFGRGIGEWQNVLEAVPKWPGHGMPVLPLWGCESDADPRAVEKKIDAAVSAGINVFIYDWYWYRGRPFLENALNEGFLKARNNSKMRFFIMWANHDVDWLWDNHVANKKCKPPRWSGAASPEEFSAISQRWIDRYFRQPNYYRIEGKPVLMIYEAGTFIRGMGGVEKAKEAIARLRAECEKASLGGVHLMICDGGYGVTQEEIRELRVDSATMYQFVHWTNMRRHEDYASWAEKAQARYRSARADLGVKDYFAHVSVGWDTNPRFPLDVVKPSVTNSSPALFEAALRRAKAWCDANTRPGAPRLVTLNSWNEWTEGSYLEPDRRFGTGYLDAVRRVFAPRSPAPNAAKAPAKGRPLLVGISDMCKKDHNTVEEYYARALERCGHIPFVIPRTDDEEALARILDRADAVIISGGGPAVSVDQCCEAPSSAPSSPDALRNRFDSAILRYAVARRMPVLGICRGEQVMNTFFGGSMHTRVPDVFRGKDGQPAINHSAYSYFGAATNPPTHTVSIVPGTKLAALLGTNDLAVASHHVQAVNRVAPGLRVCAYAPDGLIEAIESVEFPMIGVQFHPETVVAERPAKGFEISRLESLFRRLADFAAPEPPGEGAAR